VAVAAIVPGGAGVRLEWAPLPPTVNGMVAGNGAPALSRRFGRPVLSFDGQVARIAGSGTPSGLFFYFAVVPGQAYRLTVRGQVIDGSASLRLSTAGGTSYVFRAAPSGEHRYTLFADRGQVEVLIYANTAFRYALEGIALRRCDACLTPAAARAATAELEQTILRERPELARLLVTDRLRAAQVLLDWTANRIVFSLAPDPEVGTFTTDMPELGTGEIFRAFRDGTGSVYCGGAASIFDRVLKRFGYPSFTVDFGDARGDLTHVTTIVPFRVGGSWAYYMLDPTFNGYASDAAGVPVSVLEIAGAARPVNARP
jgi:hypothetical protein